MVGKGVTRMAMVAVLVSVNLSSGSAGPAGPTFNGDPQAVAEVQAAFQKFLAVSTWRARITAGGRAQEMEYVAPDRFHMLAAGQGGQATDIFIVGHEMWMHTGTQCQKLPVAMPFMNPREAVSHGPEAKITVTRGGPETIDGTPIQTYNVLVDTQGRQMQEKFSVVTATRLPRRVEMPSAQGTTVVDYSDYGAPITINNPPC